MTDKVVEEIDLELKIAEQAWGDLVRHLLERVGELESKLGKKHEADEADESTKMLNSPFTHGSQAGSTSANVKAAALAED